MALHLVTGGAGFVGVNLIRRLLRAGHEIVAVDDLSRGQLRRLEEFKISDAFSFVQADCADVGLLQVELDPIGRRISHVWHLAANSDIPAGIADPRIDLQRTFLTTFGVLDFMKRHAIPCLHFASSSAIYGNFGAQEIHEDIGPLNPISNYGAMKLASEAQIRAAVEAFLPRADVFRFPNVIGVPATHGAILDFVLKLKKDPTALDVLGNGTQQKVYLHVDDLIDAMLHISNLTPPHNVFNIGPTDEGVTVRTIAESVRDRVSPNAVIRYGEGDRGWVGDVPRFVYSTKKLADTGWSPKLGSAQALWRATEEIAVQEMAT